MTDPHVIPSRVADIPVKVKIRTSTFYSLLAIADRKFLGDLDAAIMYLLEEYKSNG